MRCRARASALSSFSKDDQSATAQRNRVMTVGLIRMPDATSCRRRLALQYRPCGNRRRADGVVNVEALPQFGRGITIEDAEDDADARMDRTCNQGDLQ